MNEDNGSEDQTPDFQKTQRFEKAEKLESAENSENLENAQEFGSQHQTQYQPQSAYQALNSQSEPQQQSWQQSQSQAHPQSQSYLSQSGSQDPQQQNQNQHQGQQYVSSQQAQSQPYSSQYQGPQYYSPRYQGYQPQPYQVQQGWSQGQYQPYQSQYSQPSVPMYQWSQSQPYQPQNWQYQSSQSPQNQRSEPQPSQFSLPQPQGYAPTQQYGQPRYQAYQYPSYQPQQPWMQPGHPAAQQYRYPSQMPQPHYTAQPAPMQYARPNGPFYQPNPAWQAMSRWLYNVRKRFSNIGFTLTMVILVWNVLALVIGQVAAIFIDPKKLPMWAELLIGNGPLYAVAIPLSLLIFRSMPKVQRKTSNMGVGMFLTVMAISFPLTSIGNVIGSMLSDLFSNGKAQNSIDELTQSLDPVSLLLFTVIIAPIFEEWLFRRLLIDHTQQYGEKTAILFSAFTFGLFHGNLFQFFYAFGFGLLLAYVYVRTGKLRYTIAMHMTFNFFGGFLPQMCYLAMSKTTMTAVDNDILGGMRKAFATGHGLEVAPLLAYLVFNGVMFIVGIVVAIVQRKKLVFYRAPEELSVGTRARTVLGNSGVIIFIVLCAIEMIASLFLN